MNVESFRGYVASLVAAIAVIGGAVGAVYVWQTANTIDPPPETALIFGVFTGLIGAGTTFLFMADSASRASHAAERSSAVGASQALAIPQTTQNALNEAVQAGVDAAQSGAAPGGPASGPLDDAESP